ncbi:radical SAM protein [Candidatus Aciduliprofundum boonei]|uniref:7-carboxy-7-deazaguanine synthase n=1 Tax=Aciduliprofundum boonei (strain DSM 19572 / T469) TaxID=439481 RepID=B5ICY1_ACIB4|nr:radical SAM protein [Candidatus Aciduliprofundum boonei]ADD09257.1 Radical SAM domain protein [Aciduliprofundum boonei T469]EDY35878.1 radical SAM domain protein [Aciduliprofundum boonei T469]HII54854.1 radical SAM protein [Candidatus Aciduliprofundum boonei]
MKVNEMFTSIQGEGIYIGVPMFFVRLTGCNLRCEWCDTEYAFYEGEEMSIDSIIKKVEESGMKWVCITGGEPLLQEEVYKLIDILLRKDYKILVETNGSILIDKLPTEENLVISLDIKTPSSKMERAMRFENLNYLGPKDFVKFVIMDENDFEYAKKIIEKYEIDKEIIFQPVGSTNLKWLAEKVVEEKLNVRVLPQLHKIIWGNKRGV